MMKRLFLIFIVAVSWVDLSAQVQKDTIRGNVKTTVEDIYKAVIPMLERIEITGSSEASTELRKRWEGVVSYLRDNKEEMAEQVLDLMVSPSGKEIDMNLVKEFIDIKKQDSITKVTINPDFWINELSALGERITEFLNQMAKQKNP